MSTARPNSELSRETEQLAQLIRQVVAARDNAECPSQPLWRRLRELGTEL